MRTYPKKGSYWESIEDNKPCVYAFILDDAGRDVLIVKFLNATKPQFLARMRKINMIYDPLIGCWRKIDVLPIPK